MDLLKGTGAATGISEDVRHDLATATFEIANEQATLAAAEQRKQHLKLLEQDRRDEERKARLAQEHLFGADLVESLHPLVTPSV